MNRIELKNKLEIISRSLIERLGYICAVHVLLELQYLGKEHYERWRKDQVPYLEKVCNINLSQLTFINTTLRKIAYGLKLQKSWTAYQRFGKGPSVRSQFSKSNSKTIEDQYATHYLDTTRIQKFKSVKNSQKTD